MPDTAVGSAEKLITLKEVTRLPWMRKSAKGKPLATSVVYRWARQGIGGRKLATVEAGGVTCTTEVDVRHFFADLTRDRVGNSAMVHDDLTAERVGGELTTGDRAGCTSGGRRRDHASAVAELAAAGIN